MRAKDIDDRGHDERTDVSSQQIKNEAELRDLVNNLLEAKIENGKLAQENSQRPDNEKDDGVGLFREGDSFHPRKTGDHDDHDTGQKIVLQIFQYFLSDLPHGVTFPGLQESLAQPRRDQQR